MSDYTRSIVRTVVPGVWAVVVLWLAKLGLPQPVSDWLASTPVAEKVTELAALGAVYAVVRWIEPRMPDWLTRILLGSARPPVYREAEQKTPVAH
ncbi:MAG TPA: hypothetical protein VFV67_34770 [Actinophytocola sp.]|uniref:hypothetical protein n=1 Tax=Actinophytocola sp. TaxID=1872138 RepID=UPI002DBD0068|nr:hypothetical protein [Actinophytocola sp.]HEU5475829.1 hypothetical protein [Actinophytocola sp.]